MTATETTAVLPADLLPLADLIHDSMQRDGTASGNRPVALDAILDVLVTLRAVQGGARYEAVATPYSDSLGNRSYIVRDNRTGATEATYEGYFAGQDARATAMLKNAGEE
jgi:hypothetical protein